MEERFEENDRFTKAGIEIVMDRVKQLPIMIRTQGGSRSQVIRGGRKARIEFTDEIRQG
jgi:hypothetical protein